MERICEENNNSISRIQSMADLFGFPPSPKISTLKQTICVVKPDAIDKANEITAILQEQGFAILHTKKLELNHTEASQFFQDSDSCGSSYLASGEIMAIVLSGADAIERLNEVLGPEGYKERQQYPSCLRNRFGTKGSDTKNGLHGSASESDAMRELHFFFPELEPIIVNILASYYARGNVQPIPMAELSELIREKPKDPLLWFADWLVSNNPKYTSKQKFGVPETK